LGNFRYKPFMFAQKSFNLSEYIYDGTKLPRDMFLLIFFHQKLSSNQHFSGATQPGWPTEQPSNLFLL